MTTQADFNLKSIISQLSPGSPESRASSGVIGSAGANFEEMFRSHSDHLSELATFAANPESGKSGDDAADLEAQLVDEDHSEIAIGSSFELQTLSLSNGRQVLTSRFDLGNDALVRAWYSDLGDEPSLDIPGTGLDQEWLDPLRDSIASQVVQGVSNAGTSVQAGSATGTLSAVPKSGLDQVGPSSLSRAVIPNDTAGLQKIDDTDVSQLRTAVDIPGVMSRQSTYGQGNTVPGSDTLSAVSPLSPNTSVKTLAEGSVPGQDGPEVMDMSTPEQDQVDSRRQLDARSGELRAKPGVPGESSEQIQQAVPQAVLRSAESRKSQDAGVTGLEYETAQAGEDDSGRKLESLLRTVEKRPQVNPQPPYGYEGGSSSTQSSMSAAAATTDYRVSAQAGGEFLAQGELAATRSEVLPTTREIAYRFTDASSFVREVPEFVAEIMREAGDKGEKHIRIRLFPENLGQIDATISETNEGLRVQLIAETAQIAKLLRDSNSVLRDMLSNGDEVQFQVDVASEQHAGNASTGSDDRNPTDSAIAINEDAGNTNTSNRVTVSSTSGLDTYV